MTHNQYRLRSRVFLAALLASAALPAAAYAAQDCQATSDQAATDCQAATVQPIRIAELQQTSAATTVPAISAAAVGPVNYPASGTEFTDAKWHLAGFADATFSVTDTGGETKTEFSSAHFNPIFHFQWKDFLLLEAETEISVNNEGETDFELEYAQADLLINDNMTLVVGQYLSPVGQFQERLHPSWVNKLANAPAGFHHDGVQPSSDVGAQLRGGISVGADSIVTYAIAVGNGPRVSPEGAFEVEGGGADPNKNKAVSGRLGFLPTPDFEVGGSFLTGKVTGEEMPGAMGGLEPTTANVKLWGADAAFTPGPLAVRGEYLHAIRDPINTVTEDSDGVEMLPKLTMEAWYGQISYRLSEISNNPTLQKFEPVVRYGRFRIVGLDELAAEHAEKRFDVGLNYWLAPSVVMRAVGEWRDFTNREAGEPDSETKFMLQFAYGY